MKLIHIAAILFLLFAGIIVFQLLDTEKGINGIPANQTKKAQINPDITSTNLTPEEEEHQLKLQFWSCKSHQ